MSVNVTLNGTTYPIPQTSESGWGDNVTSWIQAVSSSTLQKTGGLFTLTADVDFGATFGVKAVYLKSETANIAGSGVVRLANGDALSWRNSVNTADLGLKPGSADGILSYNGVDLASISASQTLTNKNISGSTNSLSNIPNSATTAASTNTASAIVARDASGNFSAGTITANLTGNASGSAASFTGSLVGDVTGTQGATVVSTVGASTAANVHLAEVAANAATSSNTAGAILKRDANGNVAANNFNEGFATTATAAGTTTLAVGSAYTQQFTGTTTQTVKLPDATTLSLGQAWMICNRSTGAVTVQNNAGSTIQVMAASSQLVVTCAATGTAAGTWDSAYSTTSAGTVTSVTLTGDGTVLSSTPSSAVTTSGTVTATLLTQTANTVLAGPSSGGALAPTFRALVAGDIPNLAGSKITTGTITAGVQHAGLIAGTNPSAGNIGEYLEATLAFGSAVALTTNTAKTVTSNTLTAGIWEVSGTVVFTGYTTACTVMTADINSTTNSVSNSLGNPRVAHNNSLGNTTDECLVVPPTRVAVSASTLYYLTCQATFSSGTCSAYGRLHAVRVG